MVVSSAPKLFGYKHFYKCISLCSVEQSDLYRSGTLGWVNNVVIKNNFHFLNIIFVKCYIFVIFFVWLLGVCSRASICISICICNNIKIICICIYVPMEGEVGREVYQITQKAITEPKLWNGGILYINRYCSFNQPQWIIIFQVYKRYCLFWCNLSKAELRLM